VTLSFAFARLSCYDLFANDEPSHSQCIAVDILLSHFYLLSMLVCFAFVLYVLSLIKHKTVCLFMVVGTVW